MFRSLIVMTAAVLTTSGASASVITKTVEYTHDGAKLKGFLAYDDAQKGKQPGVLVVHEWWGLNDYAKMRCKKLAEAGYVAFAPDMYGEGKTAAHPEDARKMSATVRKNVDAWRSRAQAGLKVLASQKNVDSAKLAAIGYCFGGSTALQLAASGADLKAIVTFHAALPKLTVADGKATRARVLICNGADDYFIKAEDIKSFKETFDKAGVKYEFVPYKGAVHSFTVPDAGKHMIKGMAYNKAADEDSWKRMLVLFKETLGK